MPAKAWVNVVVRWEDPEWVVECLDTRHACYSEHTQREDAVWHARQHARKSRPSRLVIYAKDGQEEMLFNYPLDRHKPLT